MISPSDDRGNLVSIDFAAEDHPEPCGWCRDWRYEWIEDADGKPILREWHQRDCPTIIKWEDDD